MQHLNYWPAEATIIADGYSVTDESTVLQTDIDGGLSRQRQSNAAGFVLRRFKIAIATDADLLEIKKFFARAENTTFLFTDPEDGVTSPASLRGGPGSMEFTAKVRNNRRVWTATAEVDGYRLDHFEGNQRDLRAAQWPLYAAIVADDFKFNDERLARRTQFDDGAFRQELPFSAAKRLREIIFRLTSDADLIRFRAWARPQAASNFTWSDPFDGERYQCRVVGGTSNIRYTAEVNAGRRQWRAECTIDSLLAVVHNQDKRFITVGGDYILAGGNRIFIDGDVPVKNFITLGGDHVTVGGSKIFIYA